jgi:ribose transport system ATP-binding protein
LKKAQSQEIVLEFKKITKVFPGVVAINGIDFQLFKGEVHGLVGENGAGKSTLIKTCTGAEIPSSGVIVINNKEYAALTPQISKDLNVGIIYQEFNLVGKMTIWENLFLGQLLRKGKTNKSVFIDKKSMQEYAKRVLQRLNLDIDVNTPVGELSVGRQQLVEIEKELIGGSKILIMDEPTAPLSENETAILFKLIKQLKSEGISIIFISHRLEEIFEICDRLSILRDGHLIATDVIENFTKEKLIKLMVGREMKDVFPQRVKKDIGDVMLRLDNITGNGVKNISFEIYRGEIFCLGGLVGAGRTELAQLIYGIEIPLRGSIYLNNQLVEINNPLRAIMNHIAFVPENRKEEGIVLEMSIGHNITLPILKKISKFTLINRKRDQVHVNKYVNSLQIKISSVNGLVKTLSGGNQQKIAIAKAMVAGADLIVLDEPTRGIDVGAKYEIYELMNKLIDEGKTVLMISSEMPELIGMCDRIAVLSEGRITKILERKEFSQETILHYASKNFSKNVNADSVI